MKSEYMMTPCNSELESIRQVLMSIRESGKLRLAILYGSYAIGTPHARSDIDLAVYLDAAGEKEEMEIIDRILMSTERDISILRLHDTDESPFVVQEALRGKNLVEPDLETLYAVSHWALHESESIRFRRGENYNG